MALYQQQTTLQGNGKAPTVSYYAGIKAPTPAAPSVPKGEYKFNIDLQSIGNAMIQASRDKKETELGIAKINAAEREKAEAAAEKQMKINMSNAYAQELANVTAQVDQNIIDPLAASRMVKTIDDKYRQYGILNASEMAGIRNQYDGGVSSYQENARKLIQTAQINREEKAIDQLEEFVPSAMTMPRGQQLALHYNLSNADLQLDEAIQLNGNSDNEDYAPLLQEKTNQFAINQGDTTLMNIANSDTRYSYTDGMRNILGNIDASLRKKGVNSQFRNYAMYLAYNRYGKTMKAMQEMSDDTLKYLKNQNGIIDESTLLQIRQNNPIAWTEHLLRKEGMSMDLPDDRYVAGSSDGFNDAKKYVKYGGYELNIPYTEQVGSEAVDMVAKNIPVTERQYYENYNRTHPNDPLTPAKLSTIASAGGSIPAGPLGQAASMGVLTGTYDKNVVVPAEQYYSSNFTSGERATAYSNNDGYMRNSKDNQLARANIQKQDAYEGTNRLQELDSRDRRAVYGEMSPEQYQESQKIYNENALPFINGQFSSLADSIVMLPQTGSLSLLNTYTNSANWLNSIEQKATAAKAKASLVRINNFANSIFPNDVEKRSQLARSFFDGAINIPNYTVGMGGATLKETKGEKALEVTGDVSAKASSVFMNTAVPAVESYMKWTENETKKVIDLANKKREANPELSVTDAYKDALVEVVNDDVITPLGKAIGSIVDSSFADKIRSTIDEKIDTTKSKLKSRIESLPSKEEILEDFKKGTALSDEDAGRKVEPGTIDINSTEDLPIKFNEDGTWSNFKYATIGADGWTYLVPTINMNAKEALEANKYIARFEGEDVRAVSNAEQFGQRVRQYLIDRYSSVAEPSGGLENISQPETNEFSFQQPAFTQPIDEYFRDRPVNYRALAKASRIVEAKNRQQEVKQEQTLAHSLRGVDEAFVKEFKNKTETTVENLIPIGRAFAFWEIAEQSGWVDAQRMLEETNPSLANYATINTVYAVGKGVETLSDLITATAIFLFGPTDIKPVKYVQDLVKKDKSGMLETGVDFIQAITKSPEERRKDIREDLLKAKEYIESVGNKKDLSDLYTGNDTWDMLRNLDYHLSRK